MNIIVICGSSITIVSRSSSSSNNNNNNNKVVSDYLNILSSAALAQPFLHIDGGIPNQYYYQRTTILILFVEAFVAVDDVDHALALLEQQCSLSA